MVEFLLDHGVRGFSLAVAAQAVGTSPRMLVYHFGSRAALVDAAVAEARRRQRDLFTEWLAPRPGTPYAQVLAVAWRSLETPEAQRYNRLFAEVAAIAREPGSPFGEFGARTVHDWLPMVVDGFRRDGHDDPEALATLALAAMKGLILDLGVTGDRARTRRASDALARLLAADLPPPPPP